LLVTTDRDHPGVGVPLCAKVTSDQCLKVFGFPGGALPDDVKQTTPSAQALGWITSLWFWLDRNRSGYKFSCHDSMMNYKTQGVCCVNLIVNGQTGCTPSWAANKIVYYKRICTILGVDWNGTVICPPQCAK
jgi:hypothetical protein